MVDIVFCTVHFQCFAGCQNLIRGNLYATKGNYKSSGLKNAVSFTATINARKAITKVPNTNVNISWGAQKLNRIAFIFLCFISIFSEKKVQNGWKEVTENCWKKPCLHFPISNLFGWKHNHVSITAGNSCSSVSIGNSNDSNFSWEKPINKR